MLDHLLTSKYRISYVSERTKKVVAVLIGMIPNIGGHKPTRKILVVRAQRQFGTAFPLIQITNCRHPPITLEDLISKP